VEGEVVGWAVVGGTVAGAVVGTVVGEATGGAGDAFGPQDDKSSIPIIKRDKINPISLVFISSPSLLNLSINANVPTINVPTILESRMRKRKYRKIDVTLSTHSKDGTHVFVRQSVSIMFQNRRYIILNCNIKRNDNYSFPLPSRFLYFLFLLIFLLRRDRPVDSGCKTP
jgi:hypothetical protein